MEFKFKHPDTNEIRTVYFEEEEVHELLSGHAYERVQECSCEPVGETYVVDCNCCDYLCEFDLIPFNACNNDSED